MKRNKLKIRYIAALMSLDFNEIKCATVGSIICSMNVSRGYLYKNFQTEFNTPKDYLIVEKVRRAERIIENNAIHKKTMTVKELGAQVGITRAHDFTNYYRKWRGISPAEYIEACNIRRFR